MSLDFGALGSNTNQSSTLPRMLFTDPNVFEVEKEAIFRRQWLAIGRSAQLAESGLCLHPAPARSRKARVTP